MLFFQLLLLRSPYGPANNPGLYYITNSISKYLCRFERHRLFSVSFVITHAGYCGLKIQWYTNVDRQQLYSQQEYTKIYERIEKRIYTYVCIHLLCIRVCVYVYTHTHTRIHTYTMQVSDTDWETLRSTLMITARHTFALIKKFPILIKKLVNLLFFCLIRKY